MSTVITPPAAATAATTETTTTQTTDLAALQAQVATLTNKVAEAERTAAEHQRTAEFWFNKSKEQPAAAAKADAEEPDVDVLDLATKGGKAFTAWLNKWAADNGFVKGEAMTEAINTKASELAAQGKLIAQYPELKNENSDFFKATALEYGRLKKAGVSEVVAMEMAAERTELSFLREGKLKTPAQLKDEEKVRKEQERRDRAAAGAGDHGSRRSESAEEDTELTPEQERIAVSMLAGEPGPDGKPMTPEQAKDAYKARAKKGVSMRGIR